MVLLQMSTRVDICLRSVDRIVGVLGQNQTAFLINGLCVFTPTTRDGVLNIDTNIRHNLFHAFDHQTLDRLGGLGIIRLVQLFRNSQYR